MEYEKQETYGEICTRIADWINTEKRIRTVTADDVLNLDKTFPALCISTLKSYMDKKIDPVDVFVSDPYIAKLMCKLLDARPTAL